MGKILFFIVLLSCSFVFAENPDTEKILNEGRFLYRLEKASWYGTDIFLERFPEKADSIKGYLSYAKDNFVYTIFYGNNNYNYILARIKFGTIPSKTPLSIDVYNREATPQEKILIDLRIEALKRITEDNTGFFKYYPKTSFNLIPVVNKEEQKVYIITGPQSDNVVLLGNDYLFKYDQNGRFLTKEKLHNSLIELQSKGKSGDNKVEATFHNHLISEYITQTDICTLLLYKDFTDWKIHYVLGREHVSVFDMEKESLEIMTTEAWEKKYNIKK